MPPLDSIKENEWVSLTELSSLTPYGAEYLRLLCRMGKITAKKVGKVWYTTAPILKEYADSQMLRAQVLKGGLSSPHVPKAPATEMLTVAQTPELVAKALPPSDFSAKSPPNNPPLTPTSALIGSF